LIAFTLAGVFGVLFARSSLEIARHLPRVNYFMIGVSSLFAIESLGLLLGLGPWINKWIYLTALVAVVILIVGTWQATQKKVSGSEVFLVSWGILALGIFIVNLRNLGWIVNNLFTQYALQFSSALEMVLLSFALAHRIHSERRLREQAQAQALSLRLDLVHTLQHKEIELEALVQERTLKLKQAHETLSRREHEMRELAYHDSLTGLANRKLLEDRFNQAAARAQRNGLELVIMVIDLDRFKPINDVHGHAAGDELLKVLAQRMSTRLRQSDTLARIGGDEFVVLLSDLTPSSNVDIVVHNLEAVLCAPVSWHGVELQVSGSIGCARYPQDSLFLQHLLNQADVRMYKIKQRRGLSTPLVENSDAKVATV
jgi:diguanylate cyclase (GGDEF)-like protein